MKLPVGHRYEVDDDPGRVAVDTVLGVLTTDVYWGRWRSRDVIAAQVRTSWRLVAAYERHGGHLVGFARAVSDGFALAYLADVFVLTDHQGQGLGRALMTVMIEQGPGRDFRWMLHTDDAHGLYEGFGFAPPDRTYLERPPRRARASKVPHPD